MSGAAPTPPTTLMRSSIVAWKQGVLFDKLQRLAAERAVEVVSAPQCCGGLGSNQASSVMPYNIDR
jgi:hypothetical protein